MQADARRGSGGAAEVQGELDARVLHQRYVRRWRAPKKNFKQMVDQKLAEAGGQVDYYDKVIMATGEKQFRSKGDPKPQ